MTVWANAALDRLRLGEPLALVTLLAVEGSTPREAGTRMLVWPKGQFGTIGGGNLEHQAATQARRMLGRVAAPNFAVQDYPLGPLLGQCCGGRVRVLIERVDQADAGWLADAARLGGTGRPVHIVGALGAPGEKTVGYGDAGPCGVTVNGAPAAARGARPEAGDLIIQRLPPAPPRLRLFGAGHVGKAVATALAPLPFRLEWYDSRPDFAADAGARLQPVEALRWIASEPAPFTLVMTHDHALDYALVMETLSGGGAGYIGLIGSRSKRGRFVRRLRTDGISEAALTRLVCPIGLSRLTGKAPEIIAASVAADLLIRLQALHAAEATLAGL